MRSAVAWEQFHSVREQLQRRIAEKIRKQMSSLVGNLESADLLLVAADGKKLPAHECILRARAPGFYQRHVEATVAAMGPKQDGKLREVAIGDIDSAGLEFFIHSVYTEDEIAQFPSEQEEMDDRRPLSQSSNLSFNMEESTELDFHQGGVDERSLEEETPTTGRPPLGYFVQSSGYSVQSSPRRQMSSSSSSSQAMTSSLTSGNSHLFGFNSQTNSYMTSSVPSISSVPVMTSFRDLATSSPMNTSNYSVRSEVADIPEEDEELPTNSDRKFHSQSQRQDMSMSKFIRLDSTGPSSDPMKEYLQRKRSSGGPKQIFPMFIGLSDDGQMTSNLDRTLSSDTLRGASAGRVIMSKRLSMTSLTSLTSIDMTPNENANVPNFERTPASKLASELLQMYVNNEDTDVVIRTENGDLHAHKCILSATCPFFRQQLTKSKRIELKGFSRNSVHFLLSFLYGGLTGIPDDVDIWEIIALAAHLNLKDLTDVVILHLKATRCHWFHRPCAGCVSAVFDALPQMASIRSLKSLYEEALNWQARHFARIWKGRVFLHLNERWQKECYEAVIQHMDDETVIDTILGCERLQISLPRSKAEGSVNVLSMVDDVLEVSMQFLVHSFHLVVTSKSFQQQGKGLALNLGIMEDLLPSIVHSLSADVAIKTFRGLNELLLDIQNIPPSPKRGMSLPIDEYCQRFVSLIRRLYEIVDKHLLHYAASVVKAEAWNLLTEEEQLRIQETGLFVELRQPKAPPPRLSSFNRSYKRSASVGVQFTQGSGDRSRSIERGRPLSTIQQTVPVVSSDVDMKQPENEDLLKEPLSSNTPVESPRRSRKDEKPVSSRPTSRMSAKEQTKASNGNGRMSTQPTVLPVVDKKEPERKVEEMKPTPAPAKVEKTEKDNTTSQRSNTPNENKEKVPSRTNSPRADKTVDVKKSPAKKKVLQGDESSLERQTTHTIMTVDKAKLLSLPRPEQSPSKAGEKPKSVVKPMVKDPPLAQSARLPVRTAPRTQIPLTKEIKPPTSSRTSAIPKATAKSSVTPSTTSSRASAIPSKTDAKVRPSSGPTRLVRTTRQANSNSIEK
ncbi:unnamed protein product [Auanema sp. JU1783]|nr:unnamed protein product [Auanema sp. JU1783]